MTDKKLVAAREGFNNLDVDNPRLLGSRCSACGTCYFPAQHLFCQNPDCDSEAFEGVELSNRGRIWSYTSAGYPPPAPYIVTTEPYEPFALAAVELAEEKMIVLGQLAAGVSVDDIHIGDEVELILDTLYEDDDNRYLVWKWQPLAASTSAEDRA